MGRRMGWRSYLVGRRRRRRRVCECSLSEGVLCCTIWFGMVGVSGMSVYIVLYSVFFSPSTYIFYFE